MAVTLDQAMERLNADDDEKEEVQLALDHATAVVELEVLGNDRGFVSKNEKFDELREKMLDRAILQTLTNFYLHASGDTKQNSTNAASLDALLNYTRKPSI